MPADQGVVIVGSALADSDACAVDCATAVGVWTFKVNTTPLHSRTLHNTMRVCVHRIV